ncbi:MAG: glycosyltransferase [Roseiarcus sp.]
MSKKTRMRIAWLSPLGPRSDVGAHSLAIVRALHRRAEEYDCELVVFVNRNGATYRTDAPRIVMGPYFDRRELALYDALVLNIGNNQENHAIINDIALTTRGIVVVHDIVMQHFLAWRLFESLKLPRRYADVLCKYYGPKGIDILARSGITLKDRATRYAPWDSEHAFSFPLVEPFLERAKAVIVHSQFASDVVGAMTDAPQLKLFLPSDKKPTPVSLLPSADGKVRFAVIGHVNRAKHLHLCIDAFLSSDLLQDQATLRIAGGAGDEEYIRELLEVVQQNNLQDIVKFDFNVTELRLLEIKAAADVFVNVRYPNTESASGSLVEQMACGAPVIVYDSGCYRELPERAVIKIADLSSPDALRAAMELLTADRELRESIGRAAREFGQSRRADDYAVRFLRFLGEMQSTEAHSKAVRRDDPHAFAWLDVTLDTFDRAAPRAPDIFQPRDRPIYQALAQLDADAIAAHLSLVVFCRSVSRESLELLASLLSSMPADKRPFLVSRLAFMVRLAETNRPALFSEFDFSLDVDALCIVSLCDPPAFATLMYLCVLGRAPYEGEIETYVDLLARGGPTNIVRTFVQSPEFAARSAPRGLMEWLVALPAGLDEILSRDPTNWPLVGIGDAMLGKQLGALFVDGWDKLEPEGAWTRATAARIRFRTDGRAGQTSTLRLDVRGLPPPDGADQGVTLAVNGEDIGYVPIDDGQRFQFEVLLPKIDVELITLTLTVRRLTRLADFEPLGDPRALGLFLYGLELVAGDSLD